MTRWMSALCVLFTAAALVACAGPDVDNIGGGDNSSGAFSLTNTTHYNPEGLLRGQGLKIYTEIHTDRLQADHIYDIQVTNDTTRRQLGEVYQLRTDADRAIRSYALMFDVGQYGEVEEGDNIRVELSDDAGTSLTEVISLSALRLPGWDIEEVEAPEFYVCDANGAPANAYAVGYTEAGRSPYPNEVTGEIRVTGTGFPSTVFNSEVHVYIVDAEFTEDWMNLQIPQAGQPGYIAGPFAVTVDGSGNLPVTSLGIEFGIDDIGPFDVLVDTDRNGRMDWTLGVKDAGDGTDEQVGLTIQLSQAYLDYLQELGERHILVNMAYTSSERSSGEWRNTFSAGEDVYTYLNPPVMHEYHFAVTKYVVRHQDFATFWNNPALEQTDSNGNRCVPFGQLVYEHMGIPVQRGCTNSGPVHWGPAAMVLDPQGNTDAFDVVFDRDGDDCYAPGIDLLDVVGGADTDGGLVSFEEFQALSPEDQVGFRVTE